MGASWAQALAWRMRRHSLDPVGRLSVADVVRSLGAVPAYPDAAAELAIRTRRDHSVPGEVNQALAEGRLIKVYAFRGATHLLTPEDGGAFLAVRAASRTWERSSWQAHYGLTPQAWTGLREVVREALAHGPLTREELAKAVTTEPSFRHLGFAFADRSDTMLKPLSWQGVMSFGPAREARTTFQSLANNPRWAGLPDLDEAGPRAVERYFRSYGPATHDHLHYWLGSGLGAGRNRIQSWVTSLGDRLAAVDVDGRTAHILREDLKELLDTLPTAAVRLLPAYDQWVLGPGTADPHVVPPARRTPVSRGANLVIAGGVLSGTWSERDGQVRTQWFSENGPVPLQELTAEVGRLARILDRPLDSIVRTT